MLKVVVIGSGNVAHHLISVFEVSDNIVLVQAYARQPQKISDLLPSDSITGSLNHLADADIYIIAVSDDAINEVSTLLPFQDKLVVHTSGSAGIDLINTKNRRGVFYPLQTFSKNKPVDFKSIPLCLEAENQEDFKILEMLATQISDNVYSINSGQRQALHVAAVFVSNFANHMYTIGNKICSQNNIPFNILKPLIEETANKVHSLEPVEAQTGPAVRNDTTTIKKHLDFITDENLKTIYTLLTQSIQKANVKKL